MTPTNSGGLLVGVLSATQVLFITKYFLKKQRWAKVRGREKKKKRKSFDWGFTGFRSILVTFFSPDSPATLPLSHPLLLAPVRCHCQVLSKYVLFMFLAASQYLSVWQRGIRMSPSEKCQRIKTGKSLEQCSTWGTCCREVNSMRRVPSQFDPGCEG